MIIGNAVRWHPRSDCLYTPSPPPPLIRTRNDNAERSSCVDLPIVSWWPIDVVVNPLRMHRTKRLEHDKSTTGGRLLRAVVLLRFDARAGLLLVRTMGRWSHFLCRVSV